jgi:tetratricopeptide (TPR) repeat protein
MAKPVALASLLFFAIVLGTGTTSWAERSAEADLAYERGARELRLGNFDAAETQLDRAAELAPDDPEVLTLLAQTKLALGQPDEALALLDRVKAIDPDHPQISLISGMAHYRGGEWKQAIAGLEQAIANDPSNAQAHLLLGIALQETNDIPGARAQLEEALRLDPGLENDVEYRLGVLALADQNEAEARQFFERVGSRDPSSPLARSSEIFLRSLDADDARYNLYTKLGFGYDSNVNLGPDDTTINVDEEDDAFGFLEIAGDAELFDNENATLRVGGTGFMSFYTDQSDFDLEAIRGWVQGTAKTSDITRLDLLYSYDHVWLGYDNFRGMHTIEPALRIRTAPNLLTRIFYRWQDRDYTMTPILPSLDRSGHVTKYAIDQFLFLQNPFGEGPGLVRLGYRWREDGAVGKDYDSSGSELLLSTGLSLPWLLYLTADFRYEWRDYSAAVNSLDPFFFNQAASPVGPRDDEIFYGRLALEKPVTDRVVLGASYRYLNRDSNIPLYDYDRHIVDLAATVTWY